MEPYAERLFWLSSPVGGESKLSNQKSLDRVAKQTKRPKEELYNLPKVSQEVLYLLRYFQEVKTSETLTYQEIQAWQEMTNKDLNSWELSLIFKLDAIWHKVRNENGNK